MKIWQIVLRFILAVILGWFIFQETGPATIIFYFLLVLKDAYENIFDHAADKIAGVALQELEKSLKAFEGKVNGKD